MAPIVGLVPPLEQGPLASLLWGQLLVLDDLTASTASILRLLASMPLEVADSM